MRQRNSLVLLLAVLVASGACVQKTPVQEVLEKITKLDHKDVLFESNYEGLRHELARAYIKEGRADEAIEIYTELINAEESGGTSPQKIRDYRRATRKHEYDALLSSHLVVEAMYYDGLAKALRVKHDDPRAAQAHEKAIQLEKESKDLEGSAKKEKVADLDRLLKK